MCQDGILNTPPTSYKTGQSVSRYLRQDYILEDLDNKFLSTKLLGTSPLKPDHKTYEWKVELKNGAYTAEATEITYQEFFRRRFNDIVNAPEIEVSTDVSPSTRWLFSNPKMLKSLSELTETTARMFKTAFIEARGPIELYGIWTTGEWLFHEDGWAYEPIGMDLIERLKLGTEHIKMSLIFAENPNGQTLRLKRSVEVRARLCEFNRSPLCEMSSLSWWQQNRTLTLLHWHTSAGEEKLEGIYLRRRLATPLVAPVYVSGEDCNVLKNIFERYQEKARPISC
jgi:hypothetical protein